MYASSETKTSCTLQVKQKHHVRSKWNKNIMSAPSETKTSCTLQVEKKHHVRSKWNKNIMYAPSEKIRNPNNLRCHSEQENKGHKQDSQKIWYGHVDEEDHLRFNNSYII
jgi:hypothetical protein